MKYFLQSEESPDHLLAGGCAKPTIQNPEELLPKDNKSEWAQLNPSGQGELSNINLLRAGAQIGVDTVGQSLRNANLQLRSETPNPQLYTGPWTDLSTIEPDFMRPPFRNCSRISIIETLIIIFLL